MYALSSQLTVALSVLGGFKWTGDIPPSGSLAYFFGEISLERD
jgi:hypothetical protein